MTISAEQIKFRAGKIGASLEAIETVIMWGQVRDSAALSDRDKKIMAQIFGVDGEEEMPYKEVAEWHKISKQRVRQLVARNLRKLKNRAKEL